VLMIWGSAMQAMVNLRNGNGRQEEQIL
jgi:hypothetical protein